jgi:SAM-dependent methyltransferase
MAQNYYDSERGASEYLLFHYGAPELPPPPGWAETGALEFPARCVSQCLDLRRLPAQARALDLGCAVGRSSFELARHCRRVIGLDFSRLFIDLANRLRRRGSLRFKSFEEGELTQPRRAVVAAGPGPAARDLCRRRRDPFAGGFGGVRRGVDGQFD